MMKKKMTESEVQEKQFFNHANIVYISTIIALIFFIPIFYYIGNIWLFILCLSTLLSSVIAYKLNKIKYFGLASLIFIGAITLQTTFEVIFLDISTGFVFYFFNMASLITYTNWTNKQKVIGVSLQISLFIISFMYTLTFEPIVILPSTFIIFFGITNILFNMVGVGNSAYYYTKIAHEAHMRYLQLALIDYLTNLPNRTAIAQYFDQMNQETDWINKDMALFMIDIDHFKQINDTYGHLVGDSILQELAQTLKSSKREQDFLARYGGEEFLMVVSIDSMFKMTEITEYYRKIIESTVFHINDLELKLTISIGALLKLKNVQLNQIKALEYADELLYQAKQKGRNCVVSKIY